MFHPSYLGGRDGRFEVLSPGKKEVRESLSQRRSCMWWYMSINPGMREA
jgi:hypothetical protein